MTRIEATLLMGFALTACLLLPTSLSAQPSQCQSLGGTHALADNQRILGAERGGVSTLDFSAKYAGSSVMVEGIICSPQGKPLSNTEVRLLTYSVSPDADLRASDDGRPSEEDLRVSNGHPFSTLGTRTTTTSADGQFRFIGVAPGKVALTVNWDSVPNLPAVMWNVTWESGPLMIVGREF